MVLNWEQSCPPGHLDAWRHPVVTTGGDTGIWWVEAKDAAKHPATHSVQQASSGPKCQRYHDEESLS